MSLTEAERTALWELLHRLLPIRADRSSHLLAPAWALKGRPSHFTEGEADPAL